MIVSVRLFRAPALSSQVSGNNILPIGGERKWQRTSIHLFFTAISALWHLQMDAVKDGSLTGPSPGIPPLPSSCVPLFILSSLSLEALWTPSWLILFIPHVRGQCVPHKNKPASQCEDLCVCPHPPQPSFSLSLSHLCPIDENWLHSQCFPPPWSGLLRALTGQFYALLLQLLHGEHSRQSICEDTDGNELALCLALTYRVDHVVKSAVQAFNKGKGQNM